MTTLIHGPLRQIATIKHLVAAEYCVTIDELIGQDRAARVVEPRHVAMYPSRRIANRPLTIIGREFGGRDHSTVRHAVERIDRLQNDDPDMRAVLLRLTTAYHHPVTPDKEPDPKVTV